MTTKRYPVNDILSWANRSPAELQAIARGFFVQVSHSQAPNGPMRTADGWNFSKTMELSTWVMPVARSPTSEHAFISVGRIDGNDVVLPDVTVSKFHALVRDVDGYQVLLDGDSHNGTFVNDVRVAGRRSGSPPVPLRNGDAVRFGSVQTTYVDGNGLQALLKRLAER